jgi:P2 family phage contractile tail tube protein
MNIPRVLKRFNLFVDGRGLAGRISELQLPALTLLTTEWRGGGMDGAVDIDMGVEKMEANFTLPELDPNVIGLWGLSNGNAVQLTARGALQAEGGAVVPVTISMRGMMTSWEPGAWTPGEPGESGHTVNLRYYKYNHDGRDLIEIDVENGKRIINGVDQVAGIREAIGL